MNLALCMVGGVLGVKLLSSYGRDKLIPKGLFFGITYGSIISATLSAFPTNNSRI